MNEDITRVVKIKSRPSTANGVFSDGETDDGLKFVMVERPWDDNKPDVSCIPRPARYACRLKWSEKHQKYLYHVEVASRDAIELHPGNVFEQLLGCGALGASFAMFHKDSIHDGMPSRDMMGVLASAATMAAFHDCFKDPNTGDHAPFWLDITEA